jgi:hypothetical protein
MIKASISRKGQDPRVFGDLIAKNYTKSMREDLIALRERMINEAKKIIDTELSNTNKHRFAGRHVEGRYAREERGADHFIFDRFPNYMQGKNMVFGITVRPAQDSVVGATLLTGSEAHDIAPRASSTKLRFQSYPHDRPFIGLPGKSLVQHNARYKHPGAKSQSYVVQDALDSVMRRYLGRSTILKGVTIEENYG